MKKTVVLGALNNSIFGAPFGVILIYDIEPVVMISAQKDKLHRTKLVYFWFVAMKKFHVFRALINSIFGALFCVIIIYVIEPLLKISAQKDKLHRTKLVSLELI